MTARQLISEACMEKATRTDLIQLARRHVGWSTGAGPQPVFFFKQKDWASDFIKDVEKMGSSAEIVNATPSGVAVQVQEEADKDDSVEVLDRVSTSLRTIDPMFNYLKSPPIDTKAKAVINAMQHDTDDAISRADALKKYMKGSV